MSKLSLSVAKIAAPARGTSLALPDPVALTVAELTERCAQVVGWAEGIQSVAQLDAAREWLGVVEKYLSHKNAESPAQAAGRLLDGRIGELLGPAPGRGHPEQEYARVLSRFGDRVECRLIHEHRNLWEASARQALVDGVRKDLSRRRVLRLIREDDADLRPIIERPAELLTDIRLGDFREVLADIPDGSVDLILTDPPYPAEFLPLWSDLAIFAKRVLSPSGVLAAMSGQTHLPGVFQRLGEHLTYRWTMAYLMSGSANVVHARRVSTMWKPVLVYGSSDRRLHDVATSKAADKEFHGWGQSESGFYDLISLLADPGAVVCDPFLGGGTTAVVAAARGCHFIGAEVDEAVFATAKARLA